MKLKLKLMAAAVALAASAGAANANIVTGASGNSELVLFAFDVPTNATSMWDLGVFMDHFLTTTPAVNNPGAQIQWNLNTGAISANAFAAGYAGATGATAADYGGGTALSQIAAYGAANVRWGVIALDSLNPMRFLTTSWFDYETVATTDPTNITAFSLSNNFLAAHNLLGNHSGVAHGASHATTGNGRQDQGFGAEDWLGKMAVTATGAVGEQLSFYSLATTPAGGADYRQHGAGPGFHGQWGFDMAGGTLTYAVPIPEPSEYALMLAGLGMLGFMVRRRMRQQ
ncbi:MAG: PEP-CTERM sorting domain-containing protein [Sulfuritalea sp.]|nr:PEP-CTERM sorting domain-containing protein [Sulfuritalea sp.]